MNWLTWKTEKISPPLRKEEDRKALIQGVKDGLMAKRVVTEDGEVKVVKMEMRKRKTGESDEW